MLLFSDHIEIKIGCVKKFNLGLDNHIHRSFELSRVLDIHEKYDEDQLWSTYRKKKKKQFDYDSSKSEIDRIF